MSMLMDAQVQGETLDALGQALEAERADQVSAIADHEATVAELSGRGDAESIVARDTAEAAAGRARETLERVDAALSRIAAGTYGRCVECDAVIPVERLEAIPHAGQCVGCVSRESRALR